MNIIFLDMDGVVNSEETFKQAKNDELFLKKCLEDRSIPFLINPFLRDKVNEILKTVPDCKVVWSSTWRMGLRDSKVLIEGFYNKCGFEKDSFLGYTPIKYKFRCMEILDWLNSLGEKYKVEKCAIIDDDSDAGIPENPEKEFGVDSPYVEIAKKFNTKFFKTTFKSGITDEIKNNILVYFNE